VGVRLAASQYHSASDEVLVRACRAADADAWEVLVARYRRLVYGVAVRAGLDEDLAGEAFQRVFTLLVERLDHVNQPERIRAWIVTTASREARRMRQRQLREPSFTSSVGGQPDSSEGSASWRTKRPCPTRCSSAPACGRSSRRPGIAAPCQQPNASSSSDSECCLVTRARVSWCCRD